MSTSWITYSIYVIILILGFLIGRIVTTLQIGAKYNEIVNKMRAKYESRQAQKNERKVARKEKQQARRIAKKK